MGKNNIMDITKNAKVLIASKFIRAQSEVKESSSIKIEEDKLKEAFNMIKHNMEMMKNVSFARNPSSPTIDTYSVLTGNNVCSGIIPPDKLFEAIEDESMNSMGIHTVNLAIRWNDDKIDEIESALIKGNRIIICGRPGVGRKTSLGIALSSAYAKGYIGDTIINMAGDQQIGTTNTLVDGIRVYFYIPNMSHVSKFMHISSTLMSQLKERCLVIADEGKDTSGMPESKFPVSKIEIPEPSLSDMISIIGRRLEILGYEMKDNEIEAIAQMTSRAKSEFSNPMKSIDVLRSIIVDGNKITVDTVNQKVKSLSNFVSQFVGNSSASLRDIDKTLKSRVIGQRHAINEIMNEIRKRSLKLTHGKPTTLMFAGQTGLGKTLLAKVLAETLFGSDDKMIRMNMNEYEEAHSISRLIGAPPGYIGYNAESVADRIDKMGGEVILLMDEIEKAHGNVHNILLQMLDEGVIDTSAGKHVNISSSLIIATTNAGTKSTAEKRIGFDSAANSRTDKVMTELKQIMKPEMINRFDTIAVFEPFTRNEMKQIVSIEIDELLPSINVENTAIDQIVDIAYETGQVDVYGAREINRIIRQHVEGKLLEYMEKNTLDKSNAKELSIYSDGEEIKVRRGKKK